MPKSLLKIRYKTGFTNETPLKYGPKTHSILKLTTSKFFNLTYLKNMAISRRFYVKTPHSITILFKAVQN